MKKADRDFFISVVVSLAALMLSIVALILSILL